MANYMLVDAEKLDTDLTNVADSIRAKVGTTAKLNFPSEYISAIREIPSGLEVKKTAGSFRTDDKGSATVNCGFQPDIIQITFGTNHEGYTFAAAADFESANVSKINTSIYHDLGDYSLCDIFFTRTSNGFTALFDGYNWDWDPVIVKRKNFNYTAVKYT